MTLEQILESLRVLQISMQFSGDHKDHIDAVAMIIRELEAILSEVPS